MKHFKSFLEQLNEEPPSTSYECTEDAVLVNYEASGFKLEFRLKYEVTFPYHVGADYSNPEEYELEFENKEIDEIELSKDSEFIELSNKQLNAIYKVLFIHLLK